MKFLLYITALLLAVNAQDQLPTVLWHGMGDSCCNPFSMGRIKRLIEDRLPGIYVYSVRVGSNIIADTISGFYGTVNDQIAGICEIIGNDTNLADGFNAVGFSQGGQFLRGVIQQCGFRVKNFVSIGGQHQGVFGLPHCPTEPEDSKLCEYIRHLLDYGAYESLIQNNLVQAQYWHDPLDEETYRNDSIFIAQINNEKVINEEYKESLQSLNKFAMVKFLNDSMVIPIESQWFGFYAPGQDEVVLPMRDTTLYIEDRLGLKQMDINGQLDFLEVEGDHLAFTDEWFLEEIVDVYLA